MNKKERLLKINTNLKNYKQEAEHKGCVNCELKRKGYIVQGGKHYSSPAKNKCVIHAQNTIEHERAKHDVCYYLLKAKHPYLTEAYDKKLKERNDVVDLFTGLKYEIETSKIRAKRFDGRKDVIVVPLWKDIKVKDYIELL